MSHRVNKLALATMVAALSTGLVACKKQESSETLVAQAKQYQQKGDINAAMIQLKNALLANPDDAEARFMLASAYIENGDGAAAEKEIRRAISLKYASDKTAPILARALLLQNQPQKVLDETAEESKKMGGDLTLYRAEALLALGKREESVALLDQALQAEPKNPLLLAAKGRLAKINGDEEGAMRLADEALAVAPQSPEALMFKADLLRVQRKTDEAIAQYDKVIAAKPNHRSAHIEKAYLELTAGQYDKAQADLDKAKKITPGSMLVTYTQALLDFSQNKNSAAQESVQKVLRVAPDHMPTILLAGALALRMGSVQQAEQHLRKYLEKNPDNVYARKMLASALLKTGQSPDALSVLTPALKGDSDDLQVYALAGETYMQARDFNKASEYFEKASSKAPESAGLHVQLGISKLQKGEEAKGMAELETAVKLDKTPQAGMVLARAQLAQKNFDKAANTVAELEKKFPDNEVVIELKGLVQVGKKDLAGAKASFEKAASLKPDYYSATGNLALLAMAEKKPAEAKAALQRFLDKNKKSIDAMTAMAALSAMEKNVPEATRWLELAQTENPDAVGPASRLITQYLSTNQQQKALTLARKMLATNPNNVELMELLAKSQMANKDTDGALETYSKLAGAQPKNAAVQVAIANLHMMLKNPTAAEDDIKKALQLQPDYPVAQIAYAELLFNKKQVDQALAQARAIQKKHPEAAAGYLVEGDILMKTGKPAQALPLYEKSLAMAKSIDSLTRVINAQRAAGKNAEADKRLAQAIQQFPKDARLQFLQVELSLRDKQYKQAAEQLEAMAKDAPNNPAVLNNLAFAYQQTKDSRALATAEAAYKAANTEPAIMDTLGWILVEQGGDVKRATQLLQQASTKAPQSSEIRYHLAMALFKSGDKAGARKEVEQALASNAPFSKADDARALLKQLQ
ncbi:PEP-CTERM system TPR-repeat protein PrsT [Pseudoduganella ginsengisoli]|uniref:PEP-CTERM system TPR-repeat protein PrsT n=1 Tax=Pseudoduganella ginsengisoli TaxID=1462440 RepID=A0A6L6PZA4_9BURK|nr:XrtA/PEP-CTERM system TPR-repeat protein PrsT [Pseudoduganella ginsengisoli]MTW02596.1 PEP-CTERM system TPR-repeat protein PrsT [Pseudoduganella ginsengisoli]